MRIWQILSQKQQHGSTLHSAVRRAFVHLPLPCDSLSYHLRKYRRKCFKDSRMVCSHWCSGFWQWTISAIEHGCSSPEKWESLHSTARGFQLELQGSVRQACSPLLLLIHAPSHCNILLEIEYLGLLVTVSSSSMVSLSSSTLVTVTNSKFCSHY